MPDHLPAAQRHRQDGHQVRRRRAQGLGVDRPDGRRRPHQRAVVAAGAVAVPVRRGADVEDRGRRPPDLRALRRRRQAGRRLPRRLQRQHVVGPAVDARRRRLHPPRLLLHSLVGAQQRRPDDGTAVVRE